MFNRFNKIFSSGSEFVIIKVGGSHLFEAKLNFSFMSRYFNDGFPLEADVWFVNYEHRNEHKLLIIKLFTLVAIRLRK